MTRSAFDIVSACASVLATTKSTPCRPAVIMLFTAFPPAPPTPNTVMRGLSSRISGMFRLMVMIASFVSRGRAPRPGPSGPPPVAEIFELRFRGPSETLAKPSSDASEIPARAGHELPLTPRFEMFEMRRLRVDEQARCDRKGRAPSRLRRAGNAEWTSEPHRTSNHPGRQFRQAVELAGAPSQDHMPPPIGHNRTCSQAVTHHFENFLNARFDDAHQRRVRYKLRLLALVLVLVQRRDRDHVMFVRSSAKHSAIKRFDSLGVSNPGVQSARQIHGDVVAADGEAIDVNESTGLECSNCGGAGAHVDHCRTQIGFIVGKNRKARDIGRSGHRLHIEMTSLDGKHQITGGGDIGGRHMHVDPEAGAEHSARVAYAIYAID